MKTHCLGDETQPFLAFRPNHTSSVTSGPSFCNREEAIGTFSIIGICAVASIEIEIDSVPAFLLISASRSSLLAAEVFQ